MLSYIVVCIFSVILIIELVKWHTKPVCEERLNSKSNKEKIEALEYIFANFIMSPNYYQRLKDEDIKDRDEWSVYLNRTKYMEQSYEKISTELLKSFYEI